MIKGPFDPYLIFRELLSLSLILGLFSFGKNFSHLGSTCTHMTTYRNGSLEVRSFGLEFTFSLDEKEKLLIAFTRVISESMSFIKASFL